jgi:catechol 2,3-dioxygenase-like lactoylglutathione lyase family enzyme
MVTALIVENVDRTVEFYEKALGFEVVGEYRHDDVRFFANMANGDYHIYIATGKSKVPRNIRRPGHEDTEIYFTVDDIEKVHARLTADGFQVGDIENTFYKTREVKLIDPDGYFLAIGQRVE